MAGTAQTNVPPAIYRSCDPRSATARQVYEYIRLGLNESSRQSSTFTTAPEARHLNEAVRALGSLQEDWDSNGSAAPSESVICEALYFVSRLGGLLRSTSPKVVPSAEGGVAFYFKAGSKTAYCEFTNNRELTVVMYDAEGEPEIAELPFDRSDEAARFVSGYLFH